MHLIQNADRAILDYINRNMQSELLDAVMPVVSGLGNLAFVWILTALIFLTVRRYRKQGFMIMVSVSICAIVGNLILKPFVTRIRPYELNSAIRLLIPPLNDYSFPSGHTMAAFAAATVICYTNRRFGVLAFAFAALMAFSRLYLYVHYPSDVLAGMLLGILIASLSIRLVETVTAKGRGAKRQG